MLNKTEKLAFEQIAKHKKEITALSITLSQQSEKNESEIQSIKNNIATREENIQSIIKNYIESIPIVKDGENGKDADEVNYNLIEEKIALKVKEDVSKIELPKAEQVNYKIIMEAIQNAVKKIPKAKDGEKGQAGKKGKDAVEVDYSKIVTEVLSKIKDKTIGIKDISFKLGVLKITLTDGTKKTFKLPRQVSGIHSEKVISVPTPYTNIMPVPTTLGGVEAGTTFDNVPINEVLNNLLYPYQAPSFTSFTISGLASTTYELGYTFPANDYTFVWSTSNQANIQADSIILNSTPDLANDGIETQAVLDIINTEIATHTFTISATNSKSQTFSRTLSLSWKPKTFYGESTEPIMSEAVAEALRVQNLSTSYTGSYPFTTGGYKYILFPKTFGIPTNFKDPSTNLDVAMEEIVQELTLTNTYGVSLLYYAFRTKFILGGSITINVS